MPQSSLPSMRPDELGIPTDDYSALESSRSVTDTPQMGHLYPGLPASGISTHMTSSQGSPAPNGGHTQHRAHSDPSMPPPSMVQNTDSSAGPSSLPAPPPHVRPAVDHSQVPTQSSYSLRQAYGQMADKLVDRIDAHDLVSLWCAKEDEGVSPAPVTATAQLAGPAHITNGSGKGKSVYHEPRVVQDAHLYPGARDETDYQVQSWSQMRKPVYLFLFDSGLTNQMILNILSQRSSCDPSRRQCIPVAGYRYLHRTIQSAQVIMTPKHSSSLPKTRSSSMATPMPTPPLSVRMDLSSYLYSTQVTCP